MTGLTAKGAATRRRIIEGAADVIRDLGTDSATLDEIRSATATSKSQLFHYFPDGRQQLLLAVAHYEADRVLADQQPHLSSLTTWAAWQRWRTALVRRYRKQGRTCPLATLMSELGRHDPASQEVTSSLLLRWRTDLATGIRALQADGQALTVDADTHAGALLAAVQGGVAILLATGASADLDAALDHMLEPLRPTRGVTTAS
jgi:AcrR family transcriptional regulator